MSPRQQFGMAGICAVTLFGVAWVGGQNAHRPPDITVSQQPLAPEPQQPVAPAETPVKTPEPTQVVVHVAGAVKAPKVVHLPAGSRVDDAIKAAGGAKADADLDKSINLAEILADGAKVFVHSKTEANLPVVESTTPSSEPITPSSPSSDTKSGPAGPVSLNTATEAQLETLPGVGPATAQKILDYRQEHGGFTSIQEIMAVKGIGQKKFDAMKKWLKL